MKWVTKYNGFINGKYSVFNSREMVFFAVNTTLRVDVVVVALLPVCSGRTDQHPWWMQQEVPGDPRDHPYIQKNIYKIITKQKIIQIYNNYKIWNLVYKEIVTRFQRSSESTNDLQDCPGQPKQILGDAAERPLSYYSESNSRI